MQLHENGLLRPELELLRQDHFVRHRWKEVKIGLRWVGRILIFIFEAMFEGNRIVRHVGPGMRPLERYEFEKEFQINRGSF